LLGISFEAIDTEEKLKAYVESKGLSMSDIEDGITWEEAQKLGSTMTQAYYDILSTGGRRTEGDGKVEMADIQRFNDKVIEKLAAGTGQRAEILESYMQTAKFKMVDSHRAVQLFTEKFGTNTTLFSGDTINVKALIGSYTRTELQGLACVVLSNILGQPITKDNIADALTMSKEQLETFFITMYFLGKIDNPTEILESAQGRPKLEGDTPEHLLAWLTKGTSNAVAEPPAETAATASTQDGQNPQTPMPTELKEGMKNLFEYQNDQFTTGQDGQPVSRRSITPEEYRDAVAHFQRVISDASLSAPFRAQAYSLMIVCYTSLAERATSYSVAQAEIRAAMDLLNTDAARQALGASTVFGQMIALAQLAMDDTVMYRDDPSDQLARRMEAQEFVRASIYNIIIPQLEAQSGSMTGAEITQLKAQLAQSLAGMYSREARQQAIAVADSITGSITVPAPQSAGQGGAGSRSTTIPAEEYRAMIRRMADQNPLISEGLSILVVNVDSNNDGTPDGQTLTNDQAKLDRAMALFAIVVGDNSSTPADIAKANYWTAMCLMMLASTPWGTGDHGEAVVARFQAAAQLFNAAAGQLKALIDGASAATSADTLAEYRQMRTECLARVVMISSTLSGERSTRAAGREVAQLLDASDRETQIQLGENLSLTPRDARSQLLGGRQIQGITRTVDTVGVRGRDAAAVAAGRDPDRPRTGPVADRGRGTERTTPGRDDQPPPPSGGVAVD
jgi:hypothetical protein